jgi:hypothetical protein
MLAAACASGCLAYPDGRPIGVDTAAALASVVGTGPACHSCHAPDCPNTGHECDSPQCDGSSCQCMQRSPLRAVWAVPRDAFAATANFCIRPIAYAPASVPPPGRFHPVPTQPVFMPR